MLGWHLLRVRTLGLALQIYELDGLLLGQIKGLRLRLTKIRAMVTIHAFFFGGGGLVHQHVASDENDDQNFKNSSAEDLIK